MGRRTAIIALILALAAVIIPGAAWASEEGGHGEGHGEAGEAHLNWWSADLHAPPIGWLIVDFVILFGGLYFILRKPLGAYLVNRRQTLKDQIEEVAKIKAEIDGKHREVLVRLAAVDQTVKDITVSFTVRGEEEKKKLVENAERLRVSIEQSARETIDREVAAARSKIRAEVTRSAAVIAADLLKKHLKPEDNDRFLREFVERLGTMKNDGVQ